MSKSILIVAPVSLPGQPVTERVNSFVEFFERHEIACVLYPAPRSMRDLLGLIHLIYRQKWRNVFLTLPPFRNWSLCLLPGINVILDIRDGWSIAMQSGYGGTVKPQKIKSCLARLVEQAAIRLSTLTITCTPGLEKYLATGINKKKIILIPNGVPSREYETILNMRKEIKREGKENNEIKFICAGKFSTYGRERVKNLLKKISKEFPKEKKIINIYSINKSENDWLESYIEENNILIELKNNGALSRRDILKEISKSDFGITLVRDSSYEFGTKVFDYIACGTLLYSEEDGSAGAFNEYFGKYFAQACKPEDIKGFFRESFINEKEKILIDKVG